MERSTRLTHCMLDLKDCVGLSLTLLSNLDHNNYMWSIVQCTTHVSCNNYTVLNENHSLFLK